MTTPPPKPETIDKLTWAAYPAFAMLAGMQLDVFTPLSEGAKTIQQVARVLEVQPLKFQPLLYALVSAGLLEVEDERFSNTFEADYYLARGAPGYRASSLARRWEAILKTAETIRTGVPQAKVDYAEASPADLERFFRGRHADTLAVSRRRCRWLRRSGHSPGQSLLQFMGDCG